jgi:hypothetical protein
MTDALGAHSGDIQAPHQTGTSHHHHPRLNTNPRKTVHYNMVSKILPTLIVMRHLCFSLLMNNFQSVLLPNESNLLWRLYQLTRSEFFLSLALSISSLTNSLFILG